MKLLVLSFILAALIISTLALTEEQKKKLDKVSPPCREETGATQEHREELRQNNWNNDPVKKSYVFCLFKKLKLIDENGKFSKEKLMDLTEKAAENKDEAKEVYEKCAVKKSSPKETMYEAAKCFHLSLDHWSPV